MSTYPEHEKLKGVKEFAQQLGEFIEWLENNQMCIAQKSEQDWQWYRTNKGINTLLGEYYGIDLVKLEQEKEQMLEEIRNNQYKAK